ncbi:MAG: tRNA (cytidine(56)-2'-O)-methyltransferase [Ignisphaera sp.]|nr:tRNA (cytidine(56)-2'-O)-methyltransferase [Ignisphaera sp.]MCX8168567.1 tRNA (cytidine(56)-2'-O)-methyltransferase [Ignisphaera sp.]MDW8085153.1 tRNA (cytidine(56)-2'-O)-methyltransferase [Ignisphaera sp.]
MSLCPEEHNAQLIFNRDVYVLRLGHRPGRDRRVTTHVALVARAFGAKALFLADVSDTSITRSISRVIDRWGGGYFRVYDNIDPLGTIKEFKERKACVIHLTMYGLPVSKIISDVTSRCQEILVIVGAEKVERVFYELSDYNVAIGSQPHSEVSALAIFLDRLWKGVELELCFHDAKYYIIPSAKGKVVRKVG